MKTAFPEAGLLRLSGIVVIVISSGGSPRLASLKINKLFDDKEPIDSLIPSLGLSHSLFSTALLPSPVSFFAPAYLEG